MCYPSYSVDGFLCYSKKDEPSSLTHNALLGGFLTILYFFFCAAPFPPFFSLLSLWKVMIPKNVIFFAWQVLHEKVNTLNRR